MNGTHGNGSNGGFLKGFSVVLLTGAFVASSGMPLLASPQQPSDSNTSAPQQPAQQQAPEQHPAAQPQTAQPQPNPQQPTSSLPDAPQAQRQTTPAPQQTPAGT